MRNNFNIHASELCPFCGDEVDFSRMTQFDYNEWEISRLCKRCQTETFSRCFEDDYPVMSERRRKDIEWGEINNEDRYYDNREREDHETI